MADDGKRAVRDALAAAQPLRVHTRDEQASAFGLPPGCPVIPLGVSGDVRFYLDAQKQLIALPADKHGRLGILGLFQHKVDYIYSIKHWVRCNAEGDVTGWRPEIVAQELICACGHAGVWDPSKRERGRGAWRGDDGELVLHAGDKICIFERVPDPWGSRIMLKPGLIGRYVYPAGDPVPLPADVESDDCAAEHLLRLFETWNWRRKEMDPILLLGWLAGAMIGGALQWRPAAWLTGGKGTGKSTLQKVLNHALGDGVLALSDTSAAAIWQTLKHDTLAVVVDELEAEEDNRKVLAVVKLARLAASGGKLARGSDRHLAVEFVLQSEFLFSSVLVPPLMGPDRSRIAMLELNSLPPGQPEPDINPRRIAALGAQIRRRLVVGWPRFDATVEFYRRSLATAGHTARGADQFGTLLACADLALFGNATDGAAADDWIRHMHASDMSETADDMSDEEQCLQHLLGIPIDPFRRGERVNMGEWVNRAAGRVAQYDDVPGARRVIQGYGVRVECERGVYTVAIANNHANLNALFENSRWRTPAGVMGVWTQALRRLPGAERSKMPLYFGGPQSRATVLPLALFPAPDPGLQARFGDGSSGAGGSF